MSTVLHCSVSKPSQCASKSRSRADSRDFISSDFQPRWSVSLVNVSAQRSHKAALPFLNSVLRSISRQLTCPKTAMALNYRLHSGSCLPADNFRLMHYGASIAWVNFLLAVSSSRSEQDLLWVWVLQGASILGRRRRKACVQENLSDRFYWYRQPAPPTAPGPMAALSGPPKISRDFAVH